MSPWIWILIGVVLSAVELSTTTFVLLWVGVAAIITGLLSFLVSGFAEQVIVFAVLAAVLLVVTRPLSVRLRTKKTTYISNVEGLTGERGIVVSKLANGQIGLVRVGSDVWSARAEPLDAAIVPGEWVEVVGVKSSTLSVRKLS